MTAAVVSLITSTSGGLYASSLGQGEDEQGVARPRRFQFEGASPNNLYRLGLTKESLPAGTEITVEGYQAKDRSPRAVGRNIVYADGRKFFLGLTEAEGAPKQ